jgi:hypothetical protein
LAYHDRYSIATTVHGLRVVTFLTGCNNHPSIPALSTLPPSDVTPSEESPFDAPSASAVHPTPVAASHAPPTRIRLALEMQRPRRAAKRAVDVRLTPSSAPLPAASSVGSRPTVVRSSATTKADPPLTPLKSDQLRTDCSKRPTIDQYSGAENLSLEEFKILADMDSFHLLRNDPAPPEVEALIEDPYQLGLNFALPLPTLVTFLTILKRHYRSLSYRARLRDARGIALQSEKGEDYYNPETELGRCNLLKFAFDIVGLLPVISASVGTCVSMMPSSRCFRTR